MQPTNTSAATATVLQSGMPTNGTFCSRGTDVEYWWRLPGSYAVGDVVRLDAQVQLSTYESLSMELGFWDQANSSFDTQEYCYFYSYASSNPCYTMLDAAGTDVYVRTASNPSLRRNEPLTLTLAEVAPPDPACANPPTNRSADAAAPMTLGTATRGRFCNNVLDQEYWWVVNGAFTGGMTCRLTVTFDNGAAANDVDFRVQEPDSGTGYYTVAYCSANTGTNEDCMGTLFLDNARLYVVTNSNPRNSSTDESFSMTLTCN